MKKRLTLILIFLISLSLLAVGCTSDNSGTDDPVTNGTESEETEANNILTVATYNIGDGDREEQRKLLADNNVDIVGLQEIDYDNIRFIDKGIELENPMPDFVKDPYIDSYFGEAMKFAGGAYGVATIANTELKETSSTKLFVGDHSDEATKRLEEAYEAYDPRDPDTLEALSQVQEEETNGDPLIEPRVYTRVVIEKDGKEIAFYNTHLSFEDFDIRQKQLEQILEAMKNDSAEYVIAVGDFNINATSEMYLFKDDFKLVNGQDGVWIDTYIIEYDSMNIYSIDNIIVSKNIDIKDVRVEKAELSDHLPLIAELELK